MAHTASETLCSWERGTSERNVAVVREIFTAVENGGEAGVIRHLDPEVEWFPTGFLTGGHEYRGQEGVRQWLAELADVAAARNQILTFPVHYEALDDDRVLVLGSGRLERKVSPIDKELGWIWELSGGKVTRMTNYGWCPAAGWAEVRRSGP